MLLASDTHTKVPVLSVGQSYETMTGYLLNARLLKGEKMDPIGTHSSVSISLHTYHKIDYTK